MKILLCDFLYPGLVKEYYSNISSKEKSYEELKNGITSFSHQWLPYFYLEGQEYNLNIDIVFPEDRILQKKWASEKNITSVFGTGEELFNQIKNSNLLEIDPKNKKLYLN